MAGMTEEQEKRYMSALHTVQSALRFQLERLGEKSSITLKHLAVGRSSALANQGAIAKLLIDKGVFTEAEYFDAVVEFAEREADLMTKDTRQKCGLPDSISFA